MHQHIITDRKIRIAVVGCGRVAKNHFDAIEKLHHCFELCAVCDINLTALEYARNKYRVETYSHLDDLLCQKNIDIISLCTPSGLHAQQAIKIAAKGIHVMTEKPMATRWQEGIAMVKACDEANVRLFVVKQNRKNKTLQLLHQAIQQQRFGKLYHIFINVLWTRPQAYYDQDPWRGTWEYDGGAFMNQASHYVDLLYWLGGPIKSIQAMSATLARNIEVEDAGVVNILWRNGALGSLNVSMLTYPKNLEASVTVLGEKGSVKIDGVAVNQITQWEFADRREIDENITDVNYETACVYGFGHALYYENIAAVFQQKCRADVDGREGLKSLEILTAIYRSAREGVTINLPLEY